MFNVGGPEILVVLLVALVVLGPDQLPKAMRTFGNAMAQIRKLSSGFQDEMRSAMNTLDVTAAARPGPGSSGGGSTVQETVARNAAPSGDAAPVDSAAAAPAPAVSNPPAPVVDPVADRPGASPADRAAG